MEDPYQELRKHFRGIEEVDVAEGRGAQGLKYEKKMFAMFYKGDLTVKLSPERVLELIDSGRGLPHDPGTGKAMKDRLLIPVSQRDSWLSMCNESLNYVKSGGK